MIRAGVLTDEYIKQMVDKAIDDSMKMTEMARDGYVFKDSVKQADSVKHNIFLDNVLSDSKKSKIYFGMSISVIGGLISDLALRRGDKIEHVTQYVDSCLKSDNIELDKSSPQYKRFCNEYLKGLIRGLEIHKQHEHGNYETDYDVELRNRRNYLTLQELIKLYEKDKGSTWVDASRNQSAHRQILHILGNIRLNEIDINSKVKLTESLKNYPKKISQKDMVTPWEELSKINKNRLAVRTQHFIKTAFSTLINYAKDNDLGIRGNPAKGIAGKKTVNENAHKAFTTSELQNLVNALAIVDRKKRPEMFWIPLLLLYTGARTNEVCMLRSSDIEQDNDSKAWIIKFCNKPELNQRTKTQTDRRAPVHKQLISLGFIDYLKNQKKLGQERLFENLVGSRGKWNVYFGKDFNRTFKKKFLIGYTKEQLAEKDLHSFRKTMISWYMQKPEYAANPQAINTLQSIVGHFVHPSATNMLAFVKSAEMTTNVYGGGHGQVSKQNELIQELDYELDFSILKNKK